MESEDGNLIYDFDKVLHQWKSYCENIYNGNDGQEATEELKWDNITLEPNILKSKVEDAINLLKHNKSPGSDNIMAEFLQKIGEKGTQWLHDVCDKV